MLQIRVAQFVTECPEEYFKNSSQGGSLSSRIVAHFGPESVAQFTPEWVAQYGAE